MGTVCVCPQQSLEVHRPRWQEFSSKTGLAGLQEAYDKNGNIDEILNHNLDLVADYDWTFGTNRLEATVDSGGFTTFSYTPSGAMTLYNRDGVDDDMSMYYDLHERLYYRRMPGQYGVTKPDRAYYQYNPGGQRIRKEFKYYERYTCSGITDTIIQWPSPDGPFVPMTAESSSGFDTTFGIALDPLMTTESSSGGTTTYCYRTKSNLTGYYYLADEMLFDYSGSDESDLIGNYVYAGGQRIGKFEDTTASKVVYYLDDHLGSVVATISGTDGTLLNKNIYRPFGEKIRSTVNDEDKYGYTSQELDDELDVDWYYYGARYYDPHLRIFTSVDPLWSKAPAWGAYAINLEILGPDHPRTQTSRRFLDSWGVEP